MNTTLIVLGVVALAGAIIYFLNKENKVEPVEEKAPVKGAGAKTSGKGAGAGKKPAKGAGAKTSGNGAGAGKKPAKVAGAKTSGRGAGKKVASGSGAGAGKK
jgi:hypothetical protein